MRLSVVVAGHPTRREQARNLGDLLHAHVVWDRRKGVWDTHRRALLRHRGDGWHLVVQDDAVPVAGWRDVLAEALPHADSPVVCCLPPRRWAPGVEDAFRRAVDQRVGWVEGPGPLSGVAIAYPAGLVDLLVAAADTLAVDSYDTRMKHACRTTDTPCRYLVPSVFDHDGDSIMSPGKPPRRAMRLYQAGDRFDWTADPLR